MTKEGRGLGADWLWRMLEHGGVVCDWLMGVT
mgnify:CR=1 FL=1